jgi:hypothetical protein
MVELSPAPNGDPGPLPIPIPKWFNPTYFVTGLTGVTMNIIKTMFVIILIILTPHLVLLVFYLSKAATVVIH